MPVAKVTSTKNHQLPSRKAGAMAKTSANVNKNATSLKGKLKGSKKKSSGSRANKHTVDIFSEAAIENAMYICHNVADCLAARGFPWQGATKKRKGKGKKRRK